MTRCVALLRAINLAGRNKVSMRELRDLFAALGFEDVQTLLQSGNVVFRSEAPAPDVERLLEDAVARRLGTKTDFFVRTARAWKEIVAANPFLDEARKDPGHLVVLVLKDAPGSQSVDALQRSIKGREVVRARGRQAYITYPDGIGRSRLTIAAIEQKLGTRGTARNWNTVLKLARVLESDRGAERAAVPGAKVGRPV
jgi:uncharacterized protein (DUF1697 family)